jgi:hypothetical protein
MTKEDLAAVLRNLQLAVADIDSFSGAMSETARLRHVMAEVEAALAAGIKRQAVLEVLQLQGGFRMTMDSFKSALRRIRQERKEA